MTGSKSGNKMKKMWSKKSKKFVLLSRSVKLIKKLKFKSNQVQKKLNLTNSHQNHGHLKNTAGATPTTWHMWTQLISPCSNHGSNGIKIILQIKGYSKHRKSWKRLILQLAKNKYKGLLLKTCRIQLRLRKNNLSWWVNTKLKNALSNLNCQNLFTV